MDIKIEKTETVTITDEEARKIVIRYLEENYDLDRGMLINQGIIIHEVEYTGSHKWKDKEIYREAKVIDSSVLDVLRDLGE